MKSRLFFYAVVVSITAFLISYLCYQFSGDFLNSKNTTRSWAVFKDKSNYQTINENFSFKEINSVEIQSINANVYVKHAENSQGKIEFTRGSAEQNAIQFSKQNHQVIIKVPSDSDSSVTISLPNDVEIIKIENRSGDIKMDQMKLKKLSVRAISGDVKLNEVDANEADIMAVSGDVKWNGSVKQLELESVSGDVSVESVFHSPNFNMKTISGDINVKISKPLNATLDISSTSGKVSTSQTVVLPNKNSVGSIKIRSLSGNIQVNGN